MALRDSMALHRSDCCAIWQLPLPACRFTYRMKTSYRPEIDGLRTVAVLGVVLFHLGFTSFSGGFVGVDVFFVISGYLISRNILNDIEADRFSFAEFYTRRARRILPALIFTVGATFVAGLLWLSPVAMRQLAKESTHALLSISNIQYWRESHEYFATVSNQLALLHCWSLSLEEQFYLVWPLLLLFGVRARKLWAIICGTGILSCGLAIALSRHYSEATFFLMPFRVFEFAIGASVIFAERMYVPAKTAAAGLTALGLLAIGASFPFFAPDSAFAAVTLVPSFGAAAILFAGQDSRLGQLLASSPFVSVGRASYSLYLCHWPIIFFARVIFGEAAESLVGLLIQLTLMLTTAFLMRRFVEAPFRTLIPNLKTLGRFAALTGAIAVVTHGTYLAKGWPGRLNAEQRSEVRSMEFSFQPCHPVEGGRCAFGDLGAPLGVELIGDSLAQQYVGSLDQILHDKKIRGEISRYSSGCPILVGLGLPKDNWNSRLCSKTISDELRRVRTSTTHLVIAQNWSAYRDDQYEGRKDNASGHYTRLKSALEATIKDLGKSGRKILIMGAMIDASQCNFDPARLLPSPLPHARPPDCAPKPKSVALKETAEIDAMLRAVQAQWPDQVSLIMPVDVFCDQRCPAVKNGTWLYFNPNHFNVAGAQYFGERARPILTDFLWN
jgi:peptidoglycan/LPS O-acetylase OafA/YrhL